MYDPDNLHTCLLMATVSADGDNVLLMAIIMQITYTPVSADDGGRFVRLPHFFAQASVCCIFFRDVHLVHILPGFHHLLNTRVFVFSG